MDESLKALQFDAEENRWFGRELHAYEPMLRGWLAARFPTIADFDDVIQESYVRTVKRHRVKRLTAPKAFLFATARNMCIDSVRKERTHKIVHFDSVREWDAQTDLDRFRDVPQSLIENEEYEILSKAIQSLPKKCRRIFTLRKVYGMSLKQIADELNLSSKTVESQISIGIRKCREHFLKLQKEHGQ